MDFIISKVVMSVAALLVASILAGVLSPDVFTDTDSELERVLTGLSSIVGRAVMSASEITMTWTVPFLSSGGEVVVTVHNSILSCSSGGESAFVQPTSDFHTWSYDGSMLNMSTLQALDRSTGHLEWCSGQKIMVSTEFVQFDNGPRLLVFLSPVR